MMSPDPSSLYFADQSNPQSLSLYSYVRNNPLINTDPTGLDCVYINNDTGAYEGFNRGDCDNSTTAKTNSGYYYDGNATTLYTSDGTLQGQVTGIGGTGSDGNPLINVNPAGVSPSGTGQPVGVSTDVLNWAAQQTTPVHGTWHYGNWAGPGGRGVPRDAADTGGMMRDYCYAAHGNLTTGSNFGANNAALQACNQALCDTENSVKEAITAKVNRPDYHFPSEYETEAWNQANAQTDEYKAASDMVDYFTLIPFHGNGCHP
jgi:hypothetical protein